MTFCGRVVLGLAVLGVTTARLLNFLSPILKESHKASSADIILEELISGPLRGHNIHLLVDKHSCNSIPKPWSDAATLLLATYDHLTEGSYPTHYMRGSNYIVILQYSKIPSVFLDRLSASATWNPSFLLLVNTNVSQASVEVLHHGVVQRSRHVALLQPVARATTPTTTPFAVFTSLPFRQKVSHVFMGPWDKTKYKSVTDMFVDRHPSMEGATLRLASWCDGYPFLYLRDEQCVGTSLDILGLIAATLNFSYEVQMETTDLSWGALEDGRWNGMLGDLMYNNKNLVVNLFLINYERWRDFDITDPYHTEGFGFLAPLPSPAPQWQRVAYPFTGTLWLALVVCTLTVSLLSTLLFAVVVKETDYTKHFMMVCGGVLGQSAAVQRRAWLASWWLACIIISTAYTTTLIAFLTVPVYPARMETVNELVPSPLRMVMQDYGNFVPAALKNSREVNFAALGSKLDLTPMAVGFEACVRLVLARTHVLIDTYSYLRNLQTIFNATRHSYLMKEQVYSSHAAWLLPRNTAYTHKITHLLTTLLETGFLRHFFVKHFILSDDGHQTSRTLRLSLEQLQGAFLLFLPGLAAAFTAFVAEVIWYKKIVNKNNKLCGIKI